MLNKIKTMFLCISVMMCSFIFAQEVSMGFGAVSDTSAEVTMDTPFDVGGFQFDAVGASVTAGSGGLAEEAGFTVSVGGGETVLGFSFTGSVIPAGSSGILTNLTGTFPEDVCLSGLVIANATGDALEATAGEFDCDFVDECDDVDEDGICDDEDDCVGEYDCADVCNGDAIVDECGVCEGDGPSYECSDGSLVCDESECPTADPMIGFGAWDSETMILDVDITVGDTDIGGFQFSATGITIFGALDTGLAFDNGFTVSTGPDTVIGFSFTGGFIPAGSSGILTQLVLTSVDELDACMIDVIISDTLGGGIQDDYMVGDCVMVGEVVEGCTDMAACNYDEMANTDDGSCEYPEENYDCEGNCIVEEDCTGECGGDAIVDECGVCEGDNTSCLNVVYFGAVTESDTGNSMEIWLSAVTDVAGFQFDVTGVNLDCGVDEEGELIPCASGGVEDLGWTVSYNASGTIIGFSLTGDVLAEGEHLLTVLDFNVADFEGCLTFENDGALADSNGNTLPSATGDCVTFTSAIGGCMDDMACNYNMDANVDDGSCSYPEGTCDCDGNPTEEYCDCEGNIIDECGECGGDGIADGECDCDGNVEDCAGECGGDAIVDECGECGGDGPGYECPDGSLVCDESECSSSVTISFGTVSGDNYNGNGMVEVTYDSDSDIAGFQFTVSGVTLDAASGGAAEDNGFTVSVGAGTGIVIGFAFDGSVIPLGSGVLTNLSVIGIDNETEACLSDAIISDPSGGSFTDIMVGDCADISMLDISDELPSEYSLSQNYPNPFNPTTNISFSIVDAGQVSLKVYDLSGKEINELSNNFYTPGTYNVKWDAKDSYGNQVSSGIYIYQLKTKDGILSNSMILMR